MGLGRPDWLKFLTLDLFLASAGITGVCHTRVWRLGGTGTYELRCRLRWKASTAPTLGQLVCFLLQP